MSKIDKYGMIKEMELERYSNDDGEFSLVFHQTPFGDLAEIKKHGFSNNGFKRVSGYKTRYFEDSRGNDELFYINNDRAKEWFYEEMKINKNSF